MNDYARASGRIARPVEPVVNNRNTGPAPLSPAAQARADEANAFIQEHMPDAIPFIRELVELRMFLGWRAVENCRLLKPSKPLE